MNFILEPGILVILHSLPKYANISATLLEFLVSIVDEYYPPVASRIAESITCAFKVIIEKGVITYVFSVSSMLIL